MEPCISCKSPGNTDTDYLGPIRIISGAEGEVSLPETPGCPEDGSVNSVQLLSRV